MKTIKDGDGDPVVAGDTITFSYGTPGVRVEAKIVEIDGRLIALTPGHNPSSCKLDALRGYVGEFWKIKPASNYITVRDLRP